MSVAVIAERAGVSVATVSRVLNNSTRVNPETARIVREAVKELNYDQLKVRRGPRLRGRPMQESQTLGVIVVGKPADEWIRQSVYTSAIASFMHAAGNRGLRVMMDTFVDPDKPCAAVRDRAINGAIVFVHSQADPELVRTLSQSIPIVRVMGEEFAYPAIDHVRPDHMAIGQVAHDYLIGRGCKRLMCIVSHPDSQMILVRSFGFLVSGRSDHPSPEISMVGGEISDTLRGLPVRQFENLEQIADDLERLPERPCGLFVSRDFDAIGLYSLLERRGMNREDKVHMVVCKNDDSMFSQFIHRPATIDMGGEELGRCAVDRLIHRIKQPTDAPIRILVAPQVVPPDMADNA